MKRDLQKIKDAIGNISFSSKAKSTKVPLKIKTIIQHFKIPLPDKEIERLYKKYLRFEASDILAYFMNRSNKLDVMIKEAEKKNKQILITDFALYEAVNSARGSVEVPLERLQKLLWNVIIIPQRKTKITRERMNEIRQAYGGV